jgi:hypothetical protein
VNGLSNNDSANSGAVYVFVRDASAWSQQAYIKPSNPGNSDQFGNFVDLSGDGNVLAVGSPGESSSTTGVDSTPNDDALGTGAVYVFARSDNTWDEQAYIKASNSDDLDFFGASLALSSNGRTLAVGARGEDSSLGGINSFPTNNASNSGAVYVFSYRFVLSEGALAWREQAYIKASNTGASDRFGQTLALSLDGSTLAVGAPEEDSSSNTVNSTPNNDASNTGAAYVFTRNSTFTWSQEAYIKAANSGDDDQFGSSLALSNDGNTLAIGASQEDSAISGVNNLPNDNGNSTGAVYVFTRDSSTWNQQAFVKASNYGNLDNFGIAVALAGDGNTLAVGATGESSSSTGLNSTPDDDAANAGAVYIFTRDSDVWSQQTYVKAPNSESYDSFGLAVTLSDDGDTFAVGAEFEDSGTAGVSTVPDEAATDAGAVYLY